MNDQEEKLPPHLQMQLDEVEEKVNEEEKKNPRFDRNKALMIGLLCAGLGLTLGIAMRSGLKNSLFFGAFTGLAGFVTGGYQKAKK